MGNWVAGAVRHPGAVKKAAQRHGRSVGAEARVEAKSPNKKIADRGRLALRFKGMAKKGNLRRKHRVKR